MAEVTPLENLRLSLKLSVLSAEKDFFNPSDSTITELECHDGVRLILAKPHKPETWRSTDSLLFESNQCYFCGLRNWSSQQIYELGSVSYVLILNEKHKALQYSRMCGPEPTIEHFRDMLQLAFTLKPSPIITVVNLPGSGTHTPQHFHAQLFPLVYRQGLDVKANSIASLLGNIKLAPENYNLPGSGIYMREIVAPMWGLQIQFDDTIYEPEKIGQMLYKAVHETRYRSQLHLSYNLYINSKNPSIATILFREVQKECPFRTDEVLDLIASRIGVESSKQIGILENGQWRWGWLECIGGLVTRGDSFTDANMFDGKFWKSVYDLMTLDEKYRNVILHQVKEGLIHDSGSFSKMLEREKMSDKKQDFLLEEWKSLREEVARKQNFAERLTLAAVAGNLAIYSFALREFTPVNAFVALLPIIVSTIVFYWILKDIHSVLRIILYVREYIEPNTELHWETWLRNLRERQQHDMLRQHIELEQEKRVKTKSIYVPIYHPIYNTFYFASLSISLTIALSSKGISIEAILLAFLAILIMIFWRVFATRNWIDERLEDIYTMNQELQKASRKQK